jgi:hypothetical protein
MLSQKGCHSVGPAEIGIIPAHPHFLIEIHYFPPEDGAERGFCLPPGVIEKAHIGISRDPVQFRCKGMHRKVKHSLPLSYMSFCRRKYRITIRLVISLDKRRLFMRLKLLTKFRKKTGVPGRTVQINEKSGHCGGEKSCRELPGKSFRKLKGSGVICPMTREQ